MDAPAVASLDIIDDHAALILLAAVCTLAHRDASSGNGEAKAWIADVATVKPRNMRIVGEYHDPLAMPANIARRRQRAA